MASIISALNRLLPFATPGTPLVQDVVHLIAVCTLLYFAPQIQERFRNTNHNTTPGPQDNPHPAPNIEDNINEVQDNQGELPPIGHPQPPPINPQANDDDGDDAAAEPGPAAAPPNLHRDVPLPAQRNIGAKKAKSLARKDQRRAYHEFQRAQGEAQRARDAEGADEREAALAVERERRREAEMAVEARIAREREARRVKGQREWEDDLRRRNEVVEFVKAELGRRKVCEVGKVVRAVGGVDEELVEKVVAAGGILGRKGDAVTMITGSGVIVTVEKGDMGVLYQQVLQEGHSRVEAPQLSQMLSGLI